MTNEKTNLINANLANYISRDYESLPIIQDSKYARQCYETLKREIYLQYLDLINEFTFVFTTEDTVKTSNELFYAFDSRVIPVYKTGKNDLHRDHPLGESIFGQYSTSNLVYNDIFRAVHDSYHYKVKASFGFTGECRALAAHCADLSFDARQAVYSETIGQNATFNFGNGFKRNDGTFAKRNDADFIPFELRGFSAQKFALLSLKTRRKLEFVFGG